MGKRLQYALGWIVGPTIWISSIALMIHGLWTGAWYGYVFGTILVVGAGITLIAKYRIDHMFDHMTDEERERMLRELPPEEDSEQ